MQVSNKGFNFYKPTRKSSKREEDYSTHMAEEHNNDSENSKDKNSGFEKNADEIEKYFSTIKQNNANQNGFYNILDAYNNLKETNEEDSEFKIDITV